MEAWELYARSDHDVDICVHSRILLKYVHIESQFGHQVRSAYFVRHNSFPYFKVKFIMMRLCTLELVGLVLNLKLYNSVAVKA